MLDKKGLWIQLAGESAYDFNFAYNVKYQLERALKGIDKIYNPTDEINEYSNKCVYYHIYLDQLLDAVSIVEKRFRKNEKNEDIEKHINIQRISFDFYFANYPSIFKSRNIRNITEHIDEVSIKHIQNINEADGFNVVFIDTEEKTAEKYRNSKYLVYLLDLKQNTVKASRFVKERETYSINLLELKDELEKLKHRTDIIWNYVTSDIFRYF